MKFIFNLFGGCFLLWMGGAAIDDGETISIVSRYVGERYVTAVNNPIEFGLTVSCLLIVGAILVLRSGFR